MNNINLLKTQLQQVHDWTWKLIDSICDEKLLEKPQVIESNILWQIGHLVITHFYHCMVLLKAPQQKLFSLIPIAEYYPIFMSGTTPKDNINIECSKLKDDLKKVQTKEIEIVGALTEEDLGTALFPTQFPHPVAYTKLEAVSWDIEHTMWHCGQIAMIKRVVDKRFQF